MALYNSEKIGGLDSSSCSQCISLLKKLAALGHTIVCTIHQPSALIFEMFDKLYTVVEGHCMYQGPVKELIPFLADQNLMCPSYHNPADFLLEVAVGDYERDLEKLINAANKKYFEDSDLNQLNRVTRLISQMQVENVDMSHHLSGSGKNLPKTFNIDMDTSLTSKKMSNFPAFDDYTKPVVINNDMVLEEMKALAASGGNKTKSSGAPEDCGMEMPHEKQPLNKNETTTTTTVTTHTFDSENFTKASFFMQYLLLMNRIFICAKRSS
ncbi:ATP-binding cassette sub-family G member 1-like, partial [Musca vetustissima]|uniref:ATP-binding cassette sub-family G member 1-like n=1 Tax=Musca vetustissima TaxID=27455 RepID=UPI002AB6E42F